MKGVSGSRQDTLQRARRLQCSVEGTLIVCSLLSTRAAAFEASIAPLQLESKWVGMPRGKLHSSRIVWLGQASKQSHRLAGTSFGVVTLTGLRLVGAM